MPVNRENIVKIAQKLHWANKETDEKILMEALNIFLEYFSDLDSIDLTKDDLPGYSVEDRIGSILQTMMISKYIKSVSTSDKMFVIRRICETLYYYTSNNNTRLSFSASTPSVPYNQDILNIYCAMNNIGCLPADIFENYFVPLVNKKNLNNLTESLNIMFGGGDRYIYGNQSKELMEILEKLKILNITSETDSKFKILCTDVCFKYHNPIDRLRVINEFNCKFGL